MIIHELKAATTQQEKRAVLERTNKDLLLFAYDKDKMYGVKFKDEEIHLHNLQDFCPSMLPILVNLMDRSLTGFAARNRVEQYAEEHGDLIKLVCNKDLQCGISATTINKVHPGLIPVFKLQLAKEAPLDSLVYPLAGELKYDGVRIAILFDGTETVFKTRNGKVIHLPKLSEHVSASLTYPAMLDSEVTLLGGTTLDRTKVSGMINSARQGRKVDEDLLVFNIFDAMPLDHFLKGKYEEPYIKRRRTSHLAVQLLDSPHFKLTQLTMLHSPDEVNMLFERYLAEGQEGLILKPLDHKYTFKRSRDWIKVKATLSAELECTEIVLGKGKYQDEIGALVCVGVVEGKHVKVKVGTGLSNADRRQDPHNFCRAQIEVKYNSLIQDSVTKKWSLFLPRFVEIRHDK